MGNNTQNHNPLTHNWQLIAPKLYRNLITNQLIQEQLMSFATPQEQAYFIAQLKKRMTHNHPHVLKIIYFKTENDGCNCSFESKKYNVLIYTEEKGSSLQQLIKQKSIKSASICSCLHIINSLQYLQNIYGNFQVSQRLIFINQKKQLSDQQKPIKVWISSHSEDFRREKPCSQESMCLTTIQTLKKMVENKQCSLLQLQQLNQLQQISYFRDLRDEIGKLHNSKNWNGSRNKKSISLAIQPNNKNITNSSIRVDFVQEGKRNTAVKACSMPQKTDDNSRYFNKVNESSQIIQKKRDFIQNDIIYNPSYLIKTANNSKLKVNNCLNSKIQNQNLQLNTAKIKFNYAKYHKISKDNSLQITNNKNKNEQPQTLQYQYIQTQMNSRTQSTTGKVINEPLSYPRTQITIQPIAIHINSNTSNSNQTSQQSANKNLPNNLELMSSTTNNLINQQIGKTNSIKSLSNKINKYQQINLIDREIELPIKQTDYSPEIGKLPINSRIPQEQRQTSDIQPIFYATELQTVNNQYQNKSREGRNSKNDKVGLIQNSSKKFEKYNQTIKQYQQKLKKKISEKRKQKSIPLLIISDNEISKQQTARSGDFKEANSVYNESSNEQVIGDDINIVFNDNICLKRKSTQRLNKQKKQLQNKLREQQEQQRMIYEERVRREEEQLWRRQKKQAEQIRLRREQEDRWNKEKEQQRKSKEREDQMLKKLEQQKRKTRQKLEKLQLEKNLEKEKKLIQNQMKDLLIHNAMKQQYRSIRQKVKQKKQSFAQLKAQATKILQDLDY